jgi:hypothetical protein
LVVNGEEIGSSSNDKEVKGTFNSDYVPTAGFTGSTFYTVQAGDTLQGIAKAFWGDSNLWYLIADANGGSSVTQGQVILIPAKPNTATDNSSTFKPYDPSKAIGDTTPTAPMPQGHHGGCGGVGQILMIVVAVVATVFTAGAGAVLLSGGTLATATAAQLAVAGLGAMTGTFGVGLAAVAGAVGSIAGQAVGIATGVQDGFSWKQVGLSALAGGATAGIGGTGVAAAVEKATESSALGLAAHAALANTAVQGIGVATGLQHSFSWQAVAASAVGAGVGQAVSGPLGNAFGDTPAGQFGARLATGLVAGGVAAAARGGRVAVQQVAVDAFGNALACNMVGQTNVPQQQPHLTDAQAFVNTVNDFSQAGIERYPSVNVADAGAGYDDTFRNENMQRISELAARSDAGSSSWVDANGIFHVEIRGTSADLPEAGGDGNFPNIFADIPQGPVQPSAGSMREIGPVEGFFTFNPLGRFMHGTGQAAYDAVMAIPNTAVGTGNLLRDAWGYTANAMALTPHGYQPTSGLVQSIQSNGVAGTIGLGIQSAVRNAPGIGLIGALGAPNRDWNQIGAQTLNTGMAVAGAWVRGPVANTNAVDTALLKSAGVPNTGLAALDRSAVSSSSFTQKIDAIRRAGFEVVSDPTLEARGEFSVGRFTYNPNTMTRLDMAHEWRHFNQLQQMADKGITINNKAFGIAQAPAEFGAYSYEESLWTRIGATPSDEYIAFHNAQLDTFESGMGAFRSFVAKPYNAKWRGINW